MPFTRALFFILAVAFSLTLTSCVEDKDYGEANSLRPNVNRNVESNTNQNIADDSVEKLDSLINLPFDPVENVFREEPVTNDANKDDASNPTDKRLIVVLRFSPEDTEKLIKKTSGYSTPYKASVEAEPWFPAELIAKSGTAGNEQLNGTGYSAQDFALAPWLEGSLIKIEDTEYFVLQLQTKK